MPTILQVDELERPHVARPQIITISDNHVRSEIDIDGRHHLVTDEPERRGGTDRGASPLQIFVAAICGCEATTFHKSATKLGFEYSSIRMASTYTLSLTTTATGEAPRFQSIKIEATVGSPASLLAFREVVEETERRCPVVALLATAEVRPDIVWLLDSTD